MPFCSQCGTESQGRFCAQCGAALHAAPSGGPTPGAQAQGSSNTTADLEEHVASALCYLLLPLTAVLFLVLEPYSRNRTIRFHAFQSLFVFGVLFAVSMGMAMMGFFPFIGWFFRIARNFIPLAGFLLWILLMIKAYNKERWVLPVIGPLAEKQA